MEQYWWRPALAEFLGTLMLVFVGAGSIIALRRIMSESGLLAEPGFLVGVALAHGLTIAVMVMALGHISGGHFNPAVTVATLFTRRIQPQMGLLYILFQLLGGVAGAFLLVTSVPADWWDIPQVQLGTPALHPNLDPSKAVLLEAILTFFLVLVIFGSAIDKKNTLGPAAGLAIGLTITVDILIGGPLTGAAMNPARAFGPALLSNTWANHFVYWAGPLLGGIIAGLVYDSAYLEPRRPKPEPEPGPTAEQPLPPPPSP